MSIHTWSVSISNNFSYTLDSNMFKMAVFNLKYKKSNLITQAIFFFLKIEQLE
jgi:hypothetical protein